MILHQTFDGGNDEIGFPGFVCAFVQIKRPPFVIFGEGNFLQLVFVMGNEGIRCPHNGAAAAVVLLQQNRLDIRIILPDAHDVIDVAAAEGINRLQIICDNHEVMVEAAQMMQQFELQVVQILRFIARLVLCSIIWYTSI